MMPKGRYWLAKFREALISTLPIAVVIVIFFLVTRFGMDPQSFPGEGGEYYALSNDNMISFALAVVMVVCGMALFNLGTEQSMTEIGQMVGSSLVKKKNFFFVIAMTFLLGVLVTIAEPDLSVLSNQVGVSQTVIVWSIGVGVGVFLVVGIIRISLKQDLKVVFLAFYGLAFTLIYLIDPRFLPICFDSGGVTTGPVTVPFLLGFGLGIAASRGGKNSEDSFGLTALCSIGPIIAIIFISLILKGLGQGLPEIYNPGAPRTGSIWGQLGDSMLMSSRSVALSVAPILGFFIVYELIFIKLKLHQILKIVLGMVITYFGLVLFLGAVDWAFLPIAQTVGHMLGTKPEFHYVAIAVGSLFGIFGVLAEPAVHVLVSQMENVSDGSIKKGRVLLVLAIANGLAVALHILRAHFEFPIVYYLIPGYILAFVLSFFVPKIYTAMAFDSGGVASGPMTSTFVLPFCIGIAQTMNADVYLYGFGLVAMVAMMPLLVIQGMGLEAVIKHKRALSKSRKRIVEENDDQIIHYIDFEEEAA